MTTINAELIVQSSGDSESLRRRIGFLTGSIETVLQKNGFAVVDTVVEVLSAGEVDNFDGFFLVNRSSADDLFIEVARGASQEEEVVFKVPPGRFILIPSEDTFTAYDEATFTGTADTITQVRISAAGASADVQFEFWVWSLFS